MEKERKGEEKEKKSKESFINPYTLSLNMDIDSQRCSGCGSTMTYVRIKDNTRVCRSCGQVLKINIIEKEVKDDGIWKKKERAI